MQAISAVPARIEDGGEGAVGHVGLHALGVFADRLGLGEAFLGRCRGRVERGRSMTAARCCATRC